METLWQMVNFNFEAWAGGCVSASLKNYGCAVAFGFDSFYYRSLTESEGATLAVPLGTGHEWFTRATQEPHAHHIQDEPDERGYKHAS
eukprot:3985874-Pleurochrysis_carterae.AAC.1